MPVYAQVAVDIPLFTALTYEVPDALADSVEAGVLVQVPFRNRAKTGLVMRVDAQLEDPSIASKIRPIADVVDAEPLMDARGTKFLQFIADYYLAPIGQVARLALPSFVRLEGMKHYRLLDRSADSEGSRSADLDADLSAIVAHLKQSADSVAVKDLKDLRKGLTFTRLNLLERYNLVEVTYEEKNAKVKAKVEKFYRLAQLPDGESIEDQRLGSKQQRIVDLLAGEESVALTEIREAIPSPYSSLSSLEERGLIEVREEEVYRDPFDREPAQLPQKHQLTAAQQTVLGEISSAQKARAFEGFVLHGVTGSGKTEVYVRAIRAEIAAGRRAMVLLPEIALTPQFVAVFRGHFGEQIAVLHSGLTPAEKFDQWRRIKRNEVDIVIGARSALFAPLDDIGIIIVDEEHDTSFKQGEGARYNARDMALVRGKLENARVILGSATPSLESYHNAKSGRLTYLHMPDRVAERPMPGVEIIDLREQEHGPPAPSDVLSHELVQAVDRALKNQMQAILFLNRRGFSPCVTCQSCGHVFKCVNCDVSLTYHRYQEALRCHHCDYSIRMPESCPECSDPKINRRGTGTEKLHGHLVELFPRANIARLDRDTSGGKNLRRIIRAFRKGEVDLLVGTQMVTKGHDFPGVVTVGVVMADLSLNFPDFRAAERTFQLLTQVAGRAGRGEDPGHVYIQSYNPGHYSLLAAREHDYQSFSERELQLRKELAYPPFGHLIAIKFEAAHEGRCIQAARDYATAARRVLKDDAELAESVFMLGPAMAPLSRIKGKSRWQILLKSRSRQNVRKLAIDMLNAVAHFEPNKSQYRDVRIIVDVDPVHML
jgi:primosomal protein N' (replication factor Y)